MILALSNFRGGFDEIIGITLFQPIIATILAFLTLIICGLIGLPLRINNKLNIWWRENFYISPLIAFLGIITFAISFLPDFTQRVEHEIEGYKEVIQIPNSTLIILGWFLIGFGLLHSFPPYKLQVRLSKYLNQTFKVK
jgi:hypothetical protein